MDRRPDEIVADLKYMFASVTLGVKRERLALIRDGKNFAYQQGVIDNLAELLPYLNGKKGFREEVSAIVRAAKETEPVASTVDVV